MRGSVRGLAVVASRQDLADLSVGAQVRGLVFGGRGEDGAGGFLPVRVAGVVDGQAVAAAPGVEAAGQVGVGGHGVDGLEAPGDAVEDVGALHAAVELVGDGADGDGGRRQVVKARQEVRGIDQSRGVAEVGDGGRGVVTGDGSANGSRSC